MDLYLDGVEGMVQSKYSKVSPVCGTCKMSKHKVHLEIQWSAHRRMSPFGKIVRDKAHEAY